MGIPKPLLILPVFMLAGKIVWTDDLIMILRLVFGTISLVQYVLYNIVILPKVKANATEIFVPPPATPFSAAPPAEKDYQKTTYEAHEKAQCAQKGSQALVSAMIVGALHYYFKLNPPLLLQSVMGIVNLFDEPLFQKYMLGSTERVWKEKLGSEMAAVADAAPAADGNATANATAPAAAIAGEADGADDKAGSDADGGTADGDAGAADAEDDADDADADDADDGEGAAQPAPAVSLVSEADKRAVSFAVIKAWDAGVGAEYDEVLKLAKGPLVDVGCCTDDEHAGWTPLMVAAANPTTPASLAAVRALLAEGASALDAKDEDGWNALHWAAFHGRPKAVAAILEHARTVGGRLLGDLLAAKTARTENNASGQQTALQLAEAGDEAEVVGLLRGAQDLD